MCAESTNLVVMTMCKIRGAALGTGNSAPSTLGTSKLVGTLTLLSLCFMALQQHGEAAEELRESCRNRV